MTGLTWLHLSDWHQKGADFDRKVVRDALIKDIRDRATINLALTQVDFVVFSGDIAFSGQPAEYEAAREYLFEPVLEALSLPPNRLFCIPGNHDLSRETIYEMLPPALQKPLDSDTLVQTWLIDARKLKRVLDPFEAYREFVAGYTNQPSPDYASILQLEAGGKRVGLLGLNSAWMNARNKDANGEVNDYGYTLIGEPQIHDALAKIADAELRIAVVHHPFAWLSEFDRNRTEARLGRACHFILHGHVHNPQVHVVKGTTGDCVIIPAGASYKRRVAEDSRYTNAYNFVHLDFDAAHGTVYLRRWSEQRNEWIEDIDSHPGGKFTLDTLPKALGKKKPEPGTSSSAPLKVPPPPHFERERMVLEGYLHALVRNNTHLEPGGIKQTKVQVVLPLDEIYVGLQAAHDRPDVDRRVMQEELDEINKRLERVEDPKEREKQYRIWASQAHPLEQALEISSPREELANIVQRHRQVVILGEPGSGKTTLLRYLTLRFALAILAEPERIFQPQAWWDDKNAWRLPDLGPVRLPILLRISHYAEARQKEPDLALLDYLPRYFAGLQVPHADKLGPLLQRLLEEGRCMVLLDGLDEIRDYTDRHNIAAAIGRFADVFRETGLPGWLTRSLTFIQTRVEAKPEANSGNDEAESMVIPWDKSVPEDVRQEWEKQIKQRRRQRRHDRAIQLAWDLLNEVRYAHIGNHFVVTCRIAGYHFAGVPGEFEHYTIRRMSLDDIKLFLEKWCPAVERHLTKSPDPVQVEQRARREIGGILQAVDTLPGVLEMARNPLLLRILALIHRGESHLPHRRVELYETATVTLLRDWHRERGTKGAAIDEEKAMSLLGPLAFYIHENYSSGFLSKGETERFLGRILAIERGEKDPEQPLLETREAVQQFLEAVHQNSGLFLERGQGLYGFMHLTFEEYFTARHLVSSSAQARSEIFKRLHLPRWREPILLAVGSLSKQFYADADDLLRTILDAGSLYEPVLHRDLLFAAACVGDSVNVASVLRQEIGGRLLALYCDRRRAGRYRLLQSQVKDALLMLCNDQGDVAVEAALANTLMGCPNRSALACALEVVDWLKARTPAVAHALAACPELGVLPRGQELLRAVQARLPANSNGMRPTPADWDMVREDAALARLLGVMWCYDWRAYLPSSLGIPQATCDNATRELHSLSIYRAVGLANQFSQRFSDTPNYRRETEFWEAISESLRTIWQTSPKDSDLEAATEQLIRAVAGWFQGSDETRDVAATLRLFLSFRTGFTSSREPIEVDTLLIGEALIRFQNVVREQERAVSDLDWSNVFQRAGSYLLKDISAGHTLVPIFVTAAGRLANLNPLPDDEALRASVETIQAAIGHTLLDMLRSTTDIQQYQDAVLFLSFPITEPWQSISSDSEEYRLQAEMVSIVCADIEGIDVKRRRLALQALTKPPVREHVEFTDAQVELLLGLLDAPADQATPALDILFATGLTSDLLAWCWAVLRRPDHPLAEAVREKLDGVTEIEGDRPLLALLDEGRRDVALRTISLELLRKISWQESDTFAQSLVWLVDEDTEVRHLAALLPASQDDLLALPHAVLVTAVQHELKATGASWAVLCGDAPLVRLLSGLWLQGWDDALTQLWVAQPAEPYVDREHPTEFWGSFRTYPESEDCIRWLLAKAEFGHLLIPTFRHAAARLTELEGDTVQGAPQTEHIAVVQQEISQQIDALLAQSATLPLLRVKTAILAAAIRQEAITPVSAMTLQATLEGADDKVWFATLSRLANQQDQQSLVVTALTQAFKSAVRERRLMALALLYDHEALQAAMAETLAARYLDQPAEVEEGLAVLGLLLQVKQPPAGLYPWLRALSTPENDLPLAVWLRQTLAAHGLVPNAPVPALAHLLITDEAEVRLAASLALLATDLPALLVTVLLETVQSPNDLVRVKGTQELCDVCSQLSTDGSTEAVQTLLDFRRDANANKDWHLGTVSASALGFINHTQPFWVARWLEALEQEDEVARDVARQDLNEVYQVSTDVLSILCTTLTDITRPLAARRAVTDTLGEIMRSNANQRADTTIHTALTAVLDDPDTDIRRSAAYALQWATGHTLWPVAQALLRATQSDSDEETRCLALRSLGPVLHVVRGFRDADVSKEALFRWLEAQGAERSLFGRADITEAVKQLPNLPVLEETPDADAILDALVHPDTLGLSEEIAARLRGDQEWDKLLQNTRQEWQLRRSWLETLPHLPAAIAQVEALLTTPEPAMRRTAACALARLYHGDDDRPARLSDLLSDSAPLQAMLDAVTDLDSWGDEDGPGVSPHLWAVKQIVGWVEARPSEERTRLIAGMLDDLEKAMVGMENQDDDNDDKFTDPYSGWPARRALVTVLAELSERLTYHAFTRTRDPADVVALFARAATDLDSYNTRRFAIRALGNLQQLTDQVADVFFAACQDVGDVYRETRKAVSKFKVFGPGSLERLTAAISNPSITVAYHAALLLGELGFSRSEELGRAGRKRVADELVQLLDDPLAERIVYDFRKSSDGERVGPLHDVIYEALVRVVAGPDAPATPEEGED
ncbi:MAG: metallophosphoesterase [Chloroflexi bacterium]|nr:metallophosphoesterase [Chloroflexota bacterium]MCI0574595.1 metallophosphoesterase [Chloroflexota bacterium]MCI0644053.1 metallophosphoesterase [Chloroflexota bacterium]MCI0731727.1 metallophosphoesterase [Chloroflexota bacterium]